MTNNTTEVADWGAYDGDVIVMIGLDLDIQDQQKKFHCLVIYSLQSLIEFFLLKTVVGNQIE